MASTMQIDACNLVNNICRCLCSYIEALNALCGEGTMLARNLLQTFQNIPAYQHVAQQFVYIWDEVGKATAGASAAVKTETLMKLQDVLNVLEGTNDSSIDVTLLDSFQVIGSCLFSFVELQAQFSLSTWKPLSKLSKSFTHDTFTNPLHWKSHDRNTLKVSKNSELSSTIKKHFSQLVHKCEVQKSCDPSETQSQFYVIPTVLKDNTITSNQSKSPDISVKSTSNTVVWSPATTLWSTSVESINYAACSTVSQKKSVVPVPPVSERNDLDQVINLLSCMPIGQLLSSDSQSSSSQKPYDAPFPSSYHFWTPGSGPILSRHMKNQRPWSHEGSDVTFGYDSWIWRTDNINCSSLPNGESGVIEELSNLKRPQHTAAWDNLEFQRWSIGTGENESSSDDVSSCQGQDLRKFNELTPRLFLPTRQRRYSSSDGLPDTEENMPNQQEYFWNDPNPKTSTWPLKQSSSKLEWPENLVGSKCMPLHYTSTS